jgi:hypothetical protein
MSCSVLVSDMPVNVISSIRRKQTHHHLTEALSMVDMVVSFAPPWSDRRTSATSRFLAQALYNAKPPICGGFRVRLNEVEPSRPVRTQAPQGEGVLISGRLFDGLVVVIDPSRAPNRVLLADGERGRIGLARLSHHGPGWSSTSSAASTSRHTWIGKWRFRLPRELSACGSRSTASR